MSLSRASAEAVAAVGGDPTDLLWEWIAAFGPHGANFSWGQTKRAPPGYVGIEHLEKLVEEREAASAGYRTELRKRVALGLASGDERLLQRCVQVAAVVGEREELKVLQSMGTVSQGNVAADARAAAFHLKRRLKGGGANAA